MSACAMPLNCTRTNDYNRNSMLYVFHYNEKQHGEGNGNSLQYLAQKIPWTEEPGRLQFLGQKESDTTEQLSTFCQVVLTNIEFLSPDRGKKENEEEIFTCTHWLDQRSRELIYTST